MAGEEKAITRILSAAFGIWEIVAARNASLAATRQKLRIRPTGNSGVGRPEANASRGIIEAKVGGDSTGEIQKSMADRGVVTDIPIPAYGDMWGRGV